jgi:hypothetical protein
VVSGIVFAQSVGWKQQLGVCTGASRGRSDALSATAKSKSPAGVLSGLEVQTTMSCAASTLLRTS